MKSVVNDKILNIPQRDNIRSQILKSMLIALVD
jgi:transcriptional regulator CtsR